MDAKKVLEVLRRVEWSSWDKHTGSNYCRVCNNLADNGHKPTCELATIITAAEHEAQEEQPDDAAIGGMVRRTVEKLGLKWDEAAQVHSCTLILAKHVHAAGASELRYTTTNVVDNGEPIGDWHIELKRIDAEHEAREEPGGWKPGTEPPSDDRMVLVQYRKSCPAVGAYHSSIDGYNADRFGSCRLEPEHVQWHYLPPMPEEKP